MGTSSARILWSIPVALLALTVWSLAVLPRPAPIFSIVVLTLLGVFSFVWLTFHPWLRRFRLPQWVPYALFAWAELWRLLSAPAQLLGLQNVLFVATMALFAFASAKRKRRPHARA